MWAPPTRWRSIPAPRACIWRLSPRRSGQATKSITTPLTFCATANVIVHAGATPVFADVDPSTGNLDPDATAAAITPRTRAIIPVHYGGRPADVVAFQALGARHGLVLIEDAAHCIEGVFAGRKIGTTADATSFSFYATKNLTTGEGGMVTTESADTAQRIRTASLHGMTRPAWTRYERAGHCQYDVVMPGFKYNMTDLAAAIGLHQLNAIDRHLERREAISARYDEALAGSAAVDVPTRASGQRPRATPLHHPPGRSHRGPHATISFGNWRTRASRPACTSPPFTFTASMRAGSASRAATFRPPNGSPTRSCRCRCRPRSPTRRSTTSSARRGVAFGA